MRFPLRAKQLFGVSPGDKGAAATELQDLQQTYVEPGNAIKPTSTDGWTIKALLKSPRLLPGVPAIQQALRPLTTVVRRPRRRRQQAAAAAIPEESELQGSSAAESAALQHAVSIQPLLPPEVADSLDAMLAAAEPRHSKRSHSFHPAALPGPAARSPSRGAQQLAARQHSLCDAASAKLEATLAELAAVQQHAALQASLLADCRRSAAEVREQTQQVQGQLAHCQDQIALLEQQEREEQAAFKRVSHHMAEQIDTLQRELDAMGEATRAEQRQLRQATAAAQQRAAHAQDAAWESVAAGENWRKRYELMVETHVPLTAAEERKRQADLHHYYTRNC